MYFNHSVDVPTLKRISGPFSFGEIKHRPGIYALSDHPNSAAAVVRENKMTLYLNDGWVSLFQNQFSEEFVEATMEFWLTDAPITSGLARVSPKK